MINVAVKYTERGVVENTGDIYDTLEHTKVMDCSSVIALPTMLAVKDSRGKACSFFYDTMISLSVNDVAIDTFTMEAITKALAPTGSDDSSSSDSSDSSSADDEGGSSTADEEGSSTDDGSNADSDVTEGGEG